MSTLRWGIIGSGKIAHDFIKSMDKTERQHKVVAVAASSEEKAKKLIDDLKLDAKCYGYYQYLIADPDVDIVYIALYNEAHYHWIKNALHGGKNVLCEKPICVNAHQTKEVIELAKKKKLFLMEGFWSRFFPVWQHLKRIIDSNELGKVKVASDNFGLPHDDNWRCLERGESPLTLFALYTVMFAHFVFGRKAEKITAVGAKDEFGTDNWASIVMEFDVDQRAILYYDSSIYLSQSAYVAFENGQVQIPSFFWCPQSMIKIAGPMLPENQDRKAFEYPLNDDRSYNYSNSSGLRYEQDHVYDLFQQGKLESDVMSLQHTLEIQEMLDEIRRQLGVIFPHDR